MKPAFVPMFVGLLSFSLFLGCDNPADNVPAAKTGEPTAPEVPTDVAKPKAPEPQGNPTPQPPVPATSNPNAATLAAIAAGAKTYTVQPDSTIGFIGSKVTGSHEGGFKKFTGIFTAAEGKLTPAQMIVIDMKSLWADSEKLAGHLKNEDFFDVEKFPTSSFITTAIAEADKGFTVTGNLTLHGVTKSISFPADIQVTDDEVKVQAKFSIKRFDFNIKYPGRADDLIRDEVVIKLDVKAKAS